ncbi:class II glutamine amidotransferase [Sulfitobacter donghicola]|uniref:Glutamine amidotransferase n=1 Tax=Sulfitobacter donghicola DSW-25 = KCTC 12864 = JCM 14565 TaxID=1300350 RepID=A0A073IG05_9RHOB|nr:class II glutamine amidotransferase [Sulfitobacter donghicola]KEJ88475.1 glutamine amidotransferase [Sulfitobacter donghicola DSW-25 = KCTC 12864 = JCM 14565]KIN69651.1 Glutamine amidotransferase, class-II [Sulfitobacter donghicola DSW-25 = KCTC 12864 = JCM 14565]
MCRWAAWQGAPLFVSEILAAPEHSLIQQSREAAKCKTAINADGFGVAWYDQRPEPGLYRDVYPAWSDPNLRSIAEQVRSPLFLAHVRASTGTATSRNNCHPFVQGNWSFMHNGQIGGFEGFRRQAEHLISDAHYLCRKGATDSEALFLIACGLGLDVAPKEALEQAIAQLERLSNLHGHGPHMRCAAAFSDGEVLYAVRYASDHLAPSLFYQWSDAWQGWAVVSEPYDLDHGNWIEVPKGSFCRFEGRSCEITSFDPHRHHPKLQQVV